MNVNNAIAWIENEEDRIRLEENSKKDSMIIEKNILPDKIAPFESTKNL